MGVSALANFAQGYARQRKARKYEAEFNRLDKALQPVSPEQYAYLNRVRQMGDAMRMGTDPTTAMARRGLSQSLAQTQTNISRAGGGAGAISGLLRSQQGYNQGMGDITSRSAAQSLGMLQAEGQIMDQQQMARYTLARDRRNRAMAQQAQWQQAAWGSTAAGVGGLAAGADYANEAFMNT